MIYSYKLFSTSEYKFDILLNFFFESSRIYRFHLYNKRILDF